jgi:UDP-N-acetylglucosamine--N-acetylmuramyl-(pentapeptide) pyrophosphoryl-undecaprenol N-acetylglucosamine transferase
MAEYATYVFTGGGTGGHLFPGIAVAQELRRRQPSSQIVFVGSTRAIESTIVAEHGFDHRTLPVEPLPTLKKNPFKFVWRNWQALRAAKRLLNELNPTAVIGLGGYASAPLAWTAYRRQTPVILLEQNVIPGRTTRALCHYANHICVTFADTRDYLPKARDVIVTGNAVRTEIAALHAQDRPVTMRHEMLILGGSQGADSLNEAVLATLHAMRGELSNWSIAHQTGPRQVDQVRQAYRDLELEVNVEPFFHDMAVRYAAATLVISRAGASTLTELACAGTPMILLPYPHAADDHQRANAQVFAKAGAALIVEHAETVESTAKQLTTALRQLKDDPARWPSMTRAAKELAHPDATQRIADIVANP